MIRERKHTAHAPVLTPSSLIKLAYACIFIVATSDEQITPSTAIKDMDTVNLKLLIIGDSGTGKSRYDIKYDACLGVLKITTLFKLVNFTNYVLTACC